MTLTAAVAGASGYAGGELVRLISAHPQLRLGPVTAAGNAGQPLTAIHPQLVDLAGLQLVATNADTLAEADLVFLALPHGESAAIVRALPADQPVVDLGADFRLADPAAWATYYGTDSHAGQWLYGVPELPGRRAQLAAATRVANPGCYATAIELALAPVLAAGLVEPDDVVVVAASGTSGAGRKPTERLLASEVMGSISPYKVASHQHTPEIEQALTEAAGTPVTVGFTPLLAPMPRGILATCTARLAPQVGEDVLREALHAAYAAEPFVHVLPAGSWPSTAATLGCNSVHLQVAADLHAGRAVIVAALDNLVKGAAGQAIQNANLILDLPETAGLAVHGIAP
ncbi:MAG: N-acetyl-gamma-glutamyl-phosphate reductase [Actinomycetota bacterium]|nr:MAG: N-acetyl-gamma-glutamyl-phosphate reductase [Actinomycetota bacterium]